ncbi:MAG TPA: DUF4271 domain-containing protein [Panacibacter sp.]|nr:DUF4271 domain-containing protein [Panacibacter sp.]
MAESFAQIDSLLQRMIDSAKVQQQTRKPAPLVKDTQLHAVNAAPVSSIKKDTITVRDEGLKAPATSLDSLLITDTNSIVLPDSLEKDSATYNAVTPVAGKKPLHWLEDTAFMHLLAILSAKTEGQSVYRDGNVHIPPARENLFYLLICIILLLAIIRQLFPKYFQQLFRIIFQASFRQKQTREQLMQEKMPSLLMNILFIIVGGLFIALIAGIYQWLNTSFWWLTLYSITLLALIYMFKYLVIQFMGWAFQAKEQASTYGFIVFLVNKITALVLLPLLLLLAFSSGDIQQITVTAAFFVVILLLLFRYILSFTIIRGSLSIHPIHFFIYLCGVELMPMLIIYKVLFNYTGKSN